VTTPGWDHKYTSRSPQKPSYLRDSSVLAPICHRSGNPHPLSCYLDCILNKNIKHTIKIIILAKPYQYKRCLHCPGEWKRGRRKQFRGSSPCSSSASDSRGRIHQATTQLSHPLLSSQNKKIRSSLSFSVLAVPGMAEIPAAPPLAPRQPWSRISPSRFLWGHDVDVLDKLVIS